jgi:hypothetical protein
MKRILMDIACENIMKRFLPRKSIPTSVVLLGLGVTICACSSFPAIGAATWKEEALQHDGSKIVVTRSVGYGGRHEIGQSRPYKEQTLQFDMPGTRLSIGWEDHFSQELGASNFLPMVLDVYNGTPYLVVWPMGCLSYNKWGRSNPPYIVFKHDRKTWHRISLAELPNEIKTVNLIFSMPDVEVEKSGARVMTVSLIQQIISSYEQPEYRNILRDALKGATGVTDCREEYPDGHGGWLSADWFQHSTTEECAKFCASRKISAEFCKCFLPKKE